MLQKTISKAISIDGIGVHSGKLCSITINPASENTGILYKKDADEIESKYSNVTNTTMCTTISNKSGCSVAVVEHLSAAFYALGISNAIIDVHGDEIPFLDGSCKKFVDLIIETGITEQKSECKSLKILKSVKIGNESRWASLSPAESFIINLTCDFSSKGLKSEPLSFDFSKDDFSKDISAARTFGFFSEVEFLRKNNLARGASFENTLVFDDNGKPMNEDGLRYENEHVRHKILDIVGDLSLSQYRIIGKYNGFCSGHQINNALLFELFKDKSNFEIL